MSNNPYGFDLNGDGMEEDTRTIAVLCRLYRVDMAHARHVGQVAAALFMETRSVHGLDARYRDIVYAAGLLHNVAYAGGVKGHHTRGRDIILSSPIGELSTGDQQLVALATVFHRKRWKAERLAREVIYQALDLPQQQVALWIAALVRIADGLDYSHSQTTLLARVHITPVHIIFEAAGPFVEIDTPRADQKADMWRAVLRLPVRIIAYRDDLLLQTDEEKQSSMDAAQFNQNTPAYPKPVIDPDELITQAGRRILAYQLEKMLRHEAGTRADMDIEELHAMRVAVRRMRAALRELSSIFDKSTAKWARKGLRQLGKHLGNVRELDVEFENTRAYLATLPTDQQYDLAPFLAYLDTRRQKAVASLIIYLDSEKYQNFITSFRVLCAAPAVVSMPAETASIQPQVVRHVLPEMIYRRYAAVRAYEGKIDEVSVDTLHALRLEGKRLRYMLEFFKDALGPEAHEVKLYAEQMQDHLGTLNDAGVTMTLLKKHLKALRTQLEATSLSPGENIPQLDGSQRYLAYCELQVQQLRETFYQTWEPVIAPETRRKLAAAISVL